jgi:hypothetical protein
MTWTLQQIVDRSVSEGIDEPDAIQLANQKYKELVRKSGWLRATVNLGATDGTTATFALPEDISRVLFVRVEQTDTTVVNYETRIGENDYHRIRAGQIDPAGNCFTSDEDADGNVVLALYPTPAAGTLYVKAEKIPPTLVNDTDELKIPDEFVQGLLDGIKGVVYGDLDEDPGSSQAMEAKFQAAIGGLAAMVKARGVGDGPIALPIRGVHW